MKDKWGGMYRAEQAPVLTGWCVLVEESVGRERVWKVTVREPATDRDEAVDIATRLAREHRPDHPSLERHREIYRIGEDIWLVDVEGATSAYHFRISLARRSSA
jgi:hypothetical protein